MKINKILVAAAMALGFVSCSSEGELTPAIDTLKDTPLQINASVAGMKHVQDMMLIAYLTNSILR